MYSKVSVYVVMGIKEKAGVCENKVCEIARFKSEGSAVDFCEEWGWIYDTGKGCMKMCIGVVRMTQNTDCIQNSMFLGL